MDIDLGFRKNKKSLPYGKIILLVSFLNIAIVFGTWFSFSIFFVAILREFGLSRAYTAGIYSIGNLVIAFNAPIAGIFVDRYGARVVLTVGALVLSAGLFLNSFITSIWQLYLTYSIVTCVGISLNHMVPYAAILSNWFADRRGRALGIAFSGIGFGIMVIAPLVERLISNFGWRNAYFALSLIILFITAPLSALLQRHSPRDKGFLLKSDATRLNPLAVGGAGCAAAPPDPDISLKDALKRAKFWHVFLILMFCAAGLFTIIIHHVAYLTDMGFTTAFASSLFALIGILLIPSHILIGELSDRYGRETAFTAMTLCLVLSAAVLVSIAPSSPVWLIYFFPVLFGLGYGGVSPLFPAISSDIFASRNIGKIYGMHSLGFNIGSSMGPWIAGKLFDLWGSYFVPFSFSMVAFALADFFVWKAAPRKHKKKAQPETR